LNPGPAAQILAVANPLMKKRKPKKKTTTTISVMTVVLSLGSNCHASIMEQMPRARKRKRSLNGYAISRRQKVTLSPKAAQSTMKSMIS
jgi:hypothetical protein